MGSRLARLKPEWLLRGWTDVPRALVNWKTGNYFPLGQDEFYVLESCDGRTDFGSLAFLPRHVLLLNKLMAAGVAEECGAGEPGQPVQQFRRAANPFVGSIQWSITGRCNLNCRHCYMEAPSGQLGELPLRDLERLIDRFAAANIVSVSLTGGEPFTRDDLPDIIRKLTENKIHLVDMYTNGTLISDEVLRLLRELGLRTAFRVSFDGYGTHDLMRGTPGIEPVVIDAIRRIRAAGFEVTVLTCLDRTNVDSLLPTYELLKTLDITDWGVKRVVPVGCARGTTSRLSIGEMGDKGEALLSRWLADGRPFQFGLERFSARGRAGAEIRPASKMQTFSPDDPVCKAMGHWPYVQYDGRLMPCSGYSITDYADSMPNILEKSVAEALNHPVLRSLLDMKKREVLQHNPECQECASLVQCRTGCRASALSSCGDLLAKDPIACEIWKNGFEGRLEAIISAWREDA